jgi:protein MpaA
MIGHSRETRPLEAATFGAGGPRIYIIGAIHGDEPEGQAVVAELGGRLRARSPGATIRILRDMNPDGAAAARRTNAAGVDLNRNWPAGNFRPGSRRGREALSEPESAAAHADMTAFGPDIIIAFHSSGSGPFVNFDGPGATLAATFATAAAELDDRWRVVPDMGYPTPGSMGSCWGVDRDIPILTIEMRRGDDSAAAVMAAVAGVEAIVASGFRPMGDVLACSPARRPVLTPIARKGDATRGGPR